MVPPVCVCGLGARGPLGTGVSCAAGAIPPPTTHLLLLRCIPSWCFTGRHCCPRTPRRPAARLALLVFLLPHKLAVRGPRCSANAGPAAGGLFYRARSKGGAVVATVTSASLCDGAAHARPKVAVLGAAWKMPSRGQGGGLGGLRDPFLGLAPPGHLACQRERLPLGHRDCPAPPILCPGFIFNTVF